MHSNFQLFFFFFCEFWLLDPTILRLYNTLMTDFLVGSSDTGGIPITSMVPLSESNGVPRINGKVLAFFSFDCNRNTENITSVVVTE